MNEYDRMCEDPNMNEDGQRVWSGFDWATPKVGGNAEDMIEDLAGYEEADGTWVELFDDDEMIDTLFEYLADAAHGFAADEREYSAKEMAVMFERRCVVYEEDGDGYYALGRDYLDERYDTVYKDPVVGMTAEDVRQVGANIAGSEREQEQYFWREAVDGRLFCVVRPAYAEKDGARS